MHGEALETGDCELGMRVKFAYNPHEYWVGKSNPLVGTEWECEGTIVDVTSSLVVVAWDNGKRMDYHGGCLVKCDSDMISIW